jgi:hypothetical protein
LAAIVAVGAGAGAGGGGGVTWAAFLAHPASANDPANTASKTTLWILNFCGVIVIRSPHVGINVVTLEQKQQTISAESLKKRVKKQRLDRDDKDLQNDDLRRINSGEWFCSRARRTLEKRLPKATPRRVQQQERSDNYGSIHVRLGQSLSASGWLPALPEVR